jgi:hypothetical protein
MRLIAVGAFVTALAATPVWAQQPGASAPAVTGTMGTVALASSADAPAQAAAPADGFVNFFRGTELFGTVDGYWGYSGNLPKGAGGAVIPFRVFDSAHNQLTLALVEVGLSKPATDKDRVGYRFDLDFGPVADTVNFAEPNDSLRNVQQAYVEYLAPVGSGLTFDFGKFVTPLGAEVIEAKDNWNYSRGILFGYAIPFYHVGARVSYSPTDKVSLMGAVVNGWNNNSENNGAKSVIGSITLKPSGKGSIIENVIAGQEEPAGVSTDTRWVSDTVANYTATSMWSLMGNVDYGKEGASKWWGVAAYAKGQVTPMFAIVPRFEYYDDSDGFTTLIAQKYKEFTFTAEAKPSANFMTRLEYRHDMSDVEAFTGKDGSPKKSQDTVTVGFIIGFSSK